MAGLVPATPIYAARPCPVIGVAGTSPAMTTGASTAGSFARCHPAAPTPTPFQHRDCVRQRYIFEDITHRKCRYGNDDVPRSRHVVEHLLDRPSGRRAALRPWRDSDEAAHGDRE